MLQGCNGLCRFFFFFTIDDSPGFVFQKNYMFYSCLFFRCLHWLFLYVIMYYRFIDLFPVYLFVALCWCVCVLQHCAAGGERRRAARGPLGRVEDTKHGRPSCRPSGSQRRTRGTRHASTDRLRAATKIAARVFPTACHPTLAINSPPAMVAADVVIEAREPPASPRQNGLLIRRAPCLPDVAVSPQYAHLAGIVEVTA